MDNKVQCIVTVLGMALLSVHLAQGGPLPNPTANDVFGSTTGGANALGNNTPSGPFDGNNNTGYYNTATGDGALFSNTTGYSNTATGAAALWLNTTGFYNTATGAAALYSNITGVENTAIGNGALFSNTTGVDNTATGV